MLKDDKFKAIEELIEILGQFAVTTEWLGRSKYSTFGFMYSTIQIIMKNLKPTNITELNIDLDEFGTAFDDIIPEEGDKELLKEMTNNLNNSYIQRRMKININISQNTDGLVDKIKNALYIAIDQYYNIPADELFYQHC